MNGVYDSQIMQHTKYRTRVMIDSYIMMKHTIRHNVAINLEL